MYTHDIMIPVKRLHFNHASKSWVNAPLKLPFLRGPIPIAWLSKAAQLPGKTLHVAIALWWLHGMAKGAPFKLTGKALEYLHVSRDAVTDGLARLEQQDLISVERNAGQRPVIRILELATTATQCPSLPAIAN